MSALPQPGRAPPPLSVPLLLLLLSTLLLLPTTTTAYSLPYVPTQILMPSSCYNETADSCHGRDTAYVLTRGEYGVEFLALNYSAGVDAGVKLEAATKELPFVDDESGTRAFAAVRTGDGSVVVYAGECDGGRGDVWTFAEGGHENWVKRTTEEDDTDTDTDAKSVRGPYFLGGTLAFSSTLAPNFEQPTIYTYGGMCSSPQTDASTWQAAGNYTKSMLSLAPSSAAATSYDIGVASTGGPRIPMAGFTLTPLPASITNISGVVTQQASYVLLGGHTQSAFINMSTAAVWNLPQEAWTYVAVQAPDGDGDVGGSELVRAAEGVYSRSGHTAVLSGDGKSVVVLGGWVGDVDTPAEPQLAVLEMSGAYSGWQWKIPSEQPDTSVYGHGAAVLPGDVMVAYGGWEIGSTKKAKQRRQAASSTPRFLNLTSMEWTTSYTNPSSISADDSSQDAPHSSSDSTKSIRLGLGLGLGLGIGLIILLLLAFLCYRRKHRAERLSREEAVRNLSHDAGHFLNDNDEMMERDDVFPWGPGGWYSGGQDAYGQGERSLGFESLRGGRGGQPGPSVLRKPVARQLRGGYVPAGPRPGNFISTPGHIHPILEDEEEDYSHRPYAEPHTPTSEAPSDPFLTPTGTTAAPPVFMPLPGRASSTPSPDGGARRHDPEVQDWVSDVDAADAMLARMNTRHGRSSPTRKGSHRSAALRDDDSRSGSNLSDSTRSAADSLRLSPVMRRANPAGGSSTLLGSTEHQKPGSSGSSSYNTAKSTFGALQAEGPSLLLGRTTPSSPVYYEDDEPGSPSKSKPLRRGWLGSLKRVFSNSGSTTPETSSSLRDESPRRPSLDQFSSDYEPRLVGLSGELLRRKQGRHDWDDGRGDGEAHMENEWDIERAVEQRLVQVMFTVPKERLRVVNGVDEEEESQAAELVDPEKRDDASESRLGVSPEPGESVMEKDGLLMVDDEDGSEKRLSHGTDLSGAVYTAETVTMRRPRSKVLQMVDTIERDSKESSPRDSPSPTRES